MSTFQENLKKTVAPLIREFHPEKIILFGSHAWGVPTDESDIDLLVVVESSNLKPTVRAAKAYRSLQGIRVPIEVIVSTKKELERYQDVPSSLTRKILKSGKIVYEKS